MIYRDFEITTNTINGVVAGGFIAIHNAYDVDINTEGTCTFSHPIIEQKTLAECKNEIDKWYAETGGEAWK